VAGENPIKIAMCFNVSKEKPNHAPSDRSDGSVRRYNNMLERQFLSARRCAIAVLAMVMCPSVCDKYEFYQNGSTDWACFGIEATLWANPIYSVLDGNSGISKNKGTFLKNFVQNCGL